MERNCTDYQTFVEILRQELVPAMGCTEPIAIAYCAARARAALGAVPDYILVEASGNIIKNVKSVIVPNTNGRRGIQAAAAIGVIAGDENRGLEVISQAAKEDVGRLGDYMEQTQIEVQASETEYILDICVIVKKDGHSAKVRAVNEHTNIILVEKDGQTLESKEVGEGQKNTLDYGALSVEKIYDFAVTACLEDVQPILDRQISYNTAISQEGLRSDYGANIGKVLMRAYGGDIRIRAKAAAAAGSDARMNGCEMPVVICSGSGNQGMTASLPVIEYAKELKCPQERLYRSLLISNLVTIHQKTGIGRLSAYCGAVSAGAGAGAGIAYLCGGDYEAVIHTVVNALAITSGIICDGAKSSCAGKIAVAVDSGILGYEMYLQGQQFYGGDGIICKGVENTIRNVGQLGRVGMFETDKEIIRMMTRG